MPGIKYEIIRTLGIIGEGTKGWKKEVSIVSWNDRKPKLDIRDWDENHKKMGKGITFGKDEAMKLYNLLAGFELHSLEE